MILCNTSTVFTQNNITGGQLTWECQGNGQYVFNVEFSAECLSVTTVPVVNEIKVWNHTTLTSIPISFIQSLSFGYEDNFMRFSDLEIDSYYNENYTDNDYLGDSKFYDSAIISPSFQATIKPKIKGYKIP